MGGTPIMTTSVSADMLRSAGHGLWEGILWSPGISLKFVRPPHFPSDVECLSGQERSHRFQLLCSTVV